MKLRPCSEDGKPVSFEILMAIERINDHTFRSLTKAFEPGGDPLNKNRAYGGHVYAQAIWAAAHTVLEGFVISVCKYGQSHTCAYILRLSVLGK